MRNFFYFIIFCLLFSTNVIAETCVANKYGNVKCAPTAGGGCAVNKYGNVKCSSTRGGGCAINKYGNVKCN